MHAHVHACTHVLKSVHTYPGNIGCANKSGVLRTVNEEPVHNLLALAHKLAAVLRSEDRFVRFRLAPTNFADGGPIEAELPVSPIPTYVLERAKIAKANDEICKQYRIAHIASERLAGAFT